MTSSGMKRGLAVTAVSALAVTGLPFLTATASANTLAEQAGATEVVLHTPEDAGFASIKNDGTDTKVHLVANGGADVVQVKFEYLDGATWKTIDTVSRVNGAFSALWTPPTSVYNLPTQIRATALGNVGTEIGTPDVNTATVSSNAESVDITDAAGSSVGVFQQPYGATRGDKLLGAVSGSTSDIATNPGISISSPSGAGAVTTEDVADTVAKDATTRTFSGPVDFTGYTFDADATNGIVDQALIYTEAQGSDAEAVSLYKQTMSNVSISAAKTMVQGTETTSVTVKVVDQNGKPIVGAEVFQDNDKNNVGDAAAKYTNSRGEAVFTGIGGSAAGTTHTFFVNKNAGADYLNGEDFQRSVTITSYTPSAVSLTGDSADGAAFDFDENGAGDITVLVKDQNGNPMPGQDIRYSWTIDAFAEGVANKTTAEQSVTSGANGKAVVVFPAGEAEGSYTLNAYVNRDGNPGQGTGDLSGTPMTVKAGQAEINWSDDAVAQRQAGTTATFEAAMQLDDETGLPGRNVNIVWTKALTGNAVVAAQAAQPTNTNRTGDGSATSKTNADGKFSVALSDPAATPNVNEKGGTLDATGTATTDIGNSGAVSTPALTVEFLADLAVSDEAGTTATSQANLGGVAAPGRPVRVNILVKNKAGDTLTDLPVKVTTDHGFFTTPDATTLSELEPAPAAAEGANYGEWENKGTTYNTSTNDAGHAHAVVAIERDAGFDDDGLVTANVKFEVGGKSFTEKVVFDSSNPMNPGEVIVELAPASQQTVTVLPKAPTTENVAFYVKATDQFGNLTDETIKLSDNTADAAIENAAGVAITSITSQFTSDAPGVYGDGSAATSQVISGLWDDADTLTWTDAQTPLPAGFQEETALGADGTRSGAKDVTGSGPAIDWYVIDFAASHYGLESGDTSLTVGGTVHTQFSAVDQEGEPIANMMVNFYRTGPDDLQDGDGKPAILTLEDGTATYVWQGAKPGTAVVTSVVRTPAGALVPQAELQNKVTFEAVQPVRKHIEAGLSLSNNAKGNDVAKVNAPSIAKGAVVKLFKIRKDGKKVLVAKKSANQYGDAKFVVADSKKRAFTKYQALVVRTAKTWADWTAKKSIR